MELPADNSRDRESELDRLINEYYRAAELGSAPDQEAFIAQHPELGAELRAFFSDVGQVQAAVHQAAGDLNETLTQPRSSSIPPGLRFGTRVRYFGDYEILAELGSGGMGVVYKARQQKLKRIVALKMIKVGTLASPREIQRFQAEARATARLDHPGIVSVHEVGVHAGQHFFTMDFVDGGSLAHLHRDHPVAARRAAELVKQLAEAVHYAHLQGIVHRDLKPANVLLTTAGVPRITDFGLAKQLWTDETSEAVSMTETGQILGTAGYMAPEQAAGKSRLIGPPADIYALGAILYALLTGRAPFVGESQADTIMQVLHREPVPPRTLNPSIARDLDTLCLKCLEKEPHKRYGTAQLLADDLARFLEGRPVTARPVSKAEHAWRWCRRNPVVAALLLALVVSLLAGSTISTWFGIHASRRATQASESEQTAHTEKLRADAERDAARQAEAAADQAKKTAQHERDISAGRLYAADIQLADRARREQNLLAMQTRLEAHQPAASEDRRGWEWHYLRSQAYSHDLLLSFGNHQTWIESVAFSPDGALVASSCNFGLIQIWNSRTAQVQATIKLPGTLPGDKSFVLSWNSAGDRLLGVHKPTFANSSAAASPIRVWNPLSGKEELSIAGRQAAWSPVGKLIAVLGGEGNVSLYDPTTGHQSPLPDWTGKAAAFAFSPNGSRLALADQPAVVHIVQVDSGQKIAALRGHAAVPTIMVFGPGGTQLATAGPDKTIRIWNAESGSLTHSLAGHSSPVAHLRWHPDASRLAAVESQPIGPATANSAPAIRIWDTLAGQLQWQHPATNCAWSPDGRRLAVVVEDKKLQIWDATNWSLQQTLIGHTATILDLAWSPAGDRLATAAADVSVKIWDAAPRLPPPQIPTSRVTCWHPDGTKLAIVVSNAHSNQIQVLDFATRKTTATLNGHQEPICCLAWNPAGTQLASGSAGPLRRDEPNRGQLKIWDVANQAELLTLGENGFKAVAWSPDATKVFAFANGPSQFDPTIRVFSATSGTEMARWKTARNGPLFLCFDGSLVAHSTTSIVQDGQEVYGQRAVVVRDMDTGEERWRFRDPAPLTTTAIAIDQRRQRLAVGGQNVSTRRGEIVIRDLLQGTQICRLSTHDQRPDTLAFHPREDRLLSGGTGTLILWDLTTQQEMLVFSGVSLPGNGLTGFSGSAPTWRPDGKVLAAGTTIEFWDATLGYAHAAPLSANDLRRSPPPGAGSIGGFF